MNRNALDEFLRQGRLRRAPPNPRIARRIWNKTAKDLETARHLLPIDADRAHECAYDAAFKGVVAILRAMGRRLSYVNQRQTAVEVLRALIDDPTRASAVDAFDDMREKRNHVSYEGDESSETEAGEALVNAKRLLALLRPVFHAQLSRTP